MKKFLILFAVALIGMSACNVDPKDEFIIYNDTELCSIVDGKIITDNGLTYEIVENNTEANLAEYNRAVIVCDILKLNEDGSYQINLKSITKIQIKDYTDASTLPEGVIPTGYPVSPQSIWFSGGYLNVGFSFYLKVNSSTVHNIDIIAKRPSEEGDVLTLYLRHSAEGEPEGKIDYDQYTLVGSYISFKADDLFPTNSTTDIEVKWNWFSNPDSPESSDIIEFSEPGSIVRKN